MSNNNISYADQIFIGNRSDAIAVFEQVMTSIEANGSIDGYVETVCGDGWVIDCLCELKNALERGVI